VCGGVAGYPCVAFSLECFFSKTVKMLVNLCMWFDIGSIRCI
jgi:hypothetical protein